MRRKEDHQEDAMRSEREPCKWDHTLRKEILLEKTRRILKYLKQYVLHIYRVAIIFLLPRGD
jgi:hypothetical protein